MWWMNLNFKLRSRSDTLTAIHWHQETKDISQLFPESHAGKYHLHEFFFFIRVQVTPFPSLTEHSHQIFLKINLCEVWGPSSSLPWPWDTCTDYTTKHESKWRKQRKYRVFVVWTQSPYNSREGEPTASDQMHRTGFRSSEGGNSDFVK